MRHLWSHSLDATLCGISGLARMRGEVDDDPNHRLSLCPECDRVGLQRLASITSGEALFVILAGNAKQAVPYPGVYVADADALRGVAITDYLVVGTFMDRPDAHEILQQVHRGMDRYLLLHRSPAPS